MKTGKTISGNDSGNTNETEISIAEHKLFINRLTFSYPYQKVKLWISPFEKHHYRRFHFGKFPDGIHKIVSDLDEENKFVWINMEEGENDKALSVELKEFPALAKFWFSERIFNLLVTKFRLTRKNFTNDNQYWHEEKEIRLDNLLAFSKFTIKIETFKMRDYAQLWLSYEGISFVVKKNIEQLVSEMHMDTKLLKSVIYDHQIHNYKYLSDEIRFHSEKIYPVLRREIADNTGLELKRFPQKFKLTNDWKQIEMFYDKYLNNDEFKKVIPHNGKWDSIKEESIFFLKNRGRELMFGQKHISTDIYKGIKEYGSAAFVKYRNIKWFLIYRETEREKAMMLKEFVTGKKGFTRLSSFTGTVPSYDESLDIVLNGDSNLSEGVRNKIRLMEMETETAYFAFYLSPFQKTDPRPLEHGIYYKVKETLLSRNIMSQAIDINKFKESSFGLSMTNIGIAMTAKLGGRPWQLPTDREKELIIGFGVYRSKKIGIPYVGSAFCFDNKGVFQEFDCWPAQQEWALHNTLAEAISKYRKKNLDVERVVIHYFKDMNKRDLKQIDDLMDDLDEKIPVIVVRFNSSFNNSELIKNTKHEKYLAENGCYVRLKNHEYLLHINSNEIGSKCADAPYPLKLSFQSNRAGLLNDDELVERLMRQVYEFCLLHWRSVKQPRVPVTVAYPRMVAEIFPWFDSDVLPDAARRSLWFL